MSTIFALATPLGRSGVAVMRVSGPASREVCHRLTGGVPEPRKASLRWLRDHEGNRIDQALIIYFPGPESFTGEDCLEIQSHGSLGVIRELSRALIGFKKLRPAEAGEFTKRALLNGRMTLTEVEGLGELLQAETKAQTSQAMRLMTGDLKELAETWRKSLIKARSLLEAAIDFSDEELGHDITEPCGDLILQVSRGIENELDGIATAERIRDGFEIAVIGLPNVGKSTLVNQLARREVALVSDIPGTTRDVIEAIIEISGQKVRLLDMAGLRRTDDPVEAAGVARALQRSGEADIRLWLLEPGQHTPNEVKEGDLVYIGQADRDERGQISGKTGIGLDALITDISSRLGELTDSSPTATNARHQYCLKMAREDLLRFINLWKARNRAEELLSSHLNSAILSLDSLIGRVDTEEVLGEIFGSFCIGK